MQEPRDLPQNVTPNDRTEPTDQSHPSADDWDLHWARFAKAAAINPAQSMRFDLVQRFLRRVLVDSPRVLDLGCGCGELIERLSIRWPQARYAGFETSQTGLDAARARVPDAAWILGDILNPGTELLPWQAWATHALCVEVLEHLDDPRLFLAAATDYMAPGATLIVTVPGGPMSAYDRHVGHRQHFTKRALTALLVASGYTVEHVVRTGFPFFNLYKLATILRGEKLVHDAETAATGIWARALSLLFHALFQGNLTDSAFGWQLIAVARRP
jgi:SAM-dependent methyltransferase